MPGWEKNAVRNSVKDEVVDQQSKYSCCWFSFQGYGGLGKLQQESSQVWYYTVCMPTNPEILEVDLVETNVQSGG